MLAARVGEKGFVDGGGNRNTALGTGDVAEAFGLAGRVTPDDRDLVAAPVHPPTTTTTAVTASSAPLHRDGDGVTCSLTSASRSARSAFEHSDLVQ
jgi:hypothetical protein